MTSPLASICIPIYNGGKFLRECFASIQAQTLKDFEVLVVDDASTDDSFAIAEEFARKDARFRVHRNVKRLGLVENWNHSLELSRGQWLKGMAQDDTLEPGCLQALISACERHQCPFSFCDRNFLFDDDIDPEVREYLTRHQATVAKNFNGAVDAMAFSRVCAFRPDANPLGEPVAVIFHRSVLEKYGKFSPFLVQLCDAEYWMRVGNNTGVVRVPERLANFRVHSKSTSADNLARKQFQAGYLDPMVIRYAFLFDQDFANIRRVLYQEQGRLRTWWEFIHFVRYVSDFARSQPAAIGGVIPEMVEWEKITREFSGLSELAVVGWMSVPLQKILSLFRRSKPSRDGAGENLAKGGH